MYFLQLLLPVNVVITLGFTFLCLISACCVYTMVYAFKIKYGHSILMEEKQNNMKSYTYETVMVGLRNTFYCLAHALFLNNYILMMGIICLIKMAVLVCYIMSRK